MGDSSIIDFGYFIGQVVTDVNTDKKTPLEIVFEKGCLIVECPWRIRQRNEIVLGETDCISEPTKFSHKNVKKLLVSKKILDILFYDQLIIILKFEDNLTFEVFHASCYFEGWTLKGDNGFEVFTLPGGEVCY